MPVARSTSTFIAARLLPLPTACRARDGARVRAGRRLALATAVLLAVSAGAPPCLDAGTPDLSWSSLFSGAHIDVALTARHRPDGSVVLAGATRSASFPALPGVFPPTGAGNDDVFIICLDPSLSGAAQLLWTTFLGGSGLDVALDLAIDAQGQVAVVGYTESPDYPVSPTAPQTTAGGAGDAFLTLLDAQGAVQWSTLLGGAQRDAASSVAFDAAGTVWIGGTTASPTWPTTAGAPQPAHAGGIDAFLTRIDTTLTGSAAVVWSTLLGGAADDGFFPPGSVTGQTFELDRLTIALGTQGRVALCGSTLSNDFPVTIDAYQLSRSGGRDGFVAIIDPALTGAAALAWSTYLGGSQEEQAFGLAWISEQELIVAGTTVSPDFPVTASGLQPTYGGGSFDGFVSRLSIDPGLGSTLAWGTFLGGTGADSVVGLAQISSARVALVGNSTGPFPTTPDAWTPTYPASGGFAGRLTIVDLNAPAGAELEFSTYVSGAVGSVLWSVAASATGAQLVLGGWTNGSDYPVVNPYPGTLTLIGATGGLVDLPVGPVAPRFRRGDIDGAGAIDIADAVRLLGILFSGIPSICADAEDVNDDGQVNLADPVRLLGVLFTPGTPPLPTPGATCGEDPTPDGLGCDTAGAGC